MSFLTSCITHRSNYLQRRIWLFLTPEAQLVAALHVIPDWTVPYLSYMTWGELPEDETLARQIVRRSKSMTIVNGELYHCSVIGAFQRCVSPAEGQEILREIHEGDFGHH